MAKHWMSMHAIDVIQHGKTLKVPQVRVWCHPKNGSDDYYKTFKTYDAAKKFIASKPKEVRAERDIMLAFGGYEVVPKLVRR